MDLGNNEPNQLLANLLTIGSGLAGGVAAIIRSAKGRKAPPGICSIFGSLFIAAFAAFMVSQLLPDNLSINVRTVICGIAGMSGDRMLTVIEGVVTKKIRQLLRRL